MALGDAGVDAILVIGAVARKRAYRGFVTLSLLAINSRRLLLIILRGLNAAGRLPV
jgi:hypothetical protein